jgi:hypothetical protein
MDPLTAIGLAVALIRGGIQIYQALHDHPAATEAMKAHAKAMLPELHIQLAAAQGMYDRLQAEAMKGVQGA